MVVVSIIGLLASLAAVNYQGYVEKARIARAVAEMQSIARLLDAQSVDGGALPDTLAGVGADSMVDPWGRPYSYLRIEGNLPPGLAARDAPLPPVSARPGDANGPLGSGKTNVMSQVRKDHFLVPVNSDYDLYSVGADGQTRSQLQNKSSLDDVIRAGNG